MQVARRAGQQGERPDALAPPRREREQASTQEMRGEVLLRDRYLAARPAIADLPQNRLDRLTKHTLDRQAGEELVQQIVRPFAVECEQRRQQLLTALERYQRCAGRLRGGEAVGEPGAHPLDAGCVLVAVETEAALGAFGAEQAVATFPCAQQIDARPRAPRELTDPVHGRTVTELGQKFDKTEEEPLLSPGQNLDNIDTEWRSEMKKLDIAALALLIVGGLNWGLVGIAKFDLVAAIAGGLEFGETNWFSRVIYCLVGAAAVLAIVRLPAIARGEQRATAHAH